MIVAKAGQAYNGWTNYATWRVNLELFDGMTLEEMGFTPDGDDRYEDEARLEEFLSEMASERVTEGSGGLARDYALAFLDQVDYREIAEHLIEDFCQDNDGFYSED